MLGRLLDRSGDGARTAGVDPMQAARAAMNWRLGAILFAEMQAQGRLGFFDEHSLDSLRGAYLSTVMRNRVRRRKAVEVMRALADAHVASMVLKGGVDLLATPAEGACPRYLEDVDILVSEADCDAAVSVLTRAGFAPIPTSAPQGAKRLARLDTLHPEK